MDRSTQALLLWALLWAACIVLAFSLLSVTVLMYMLGALFVLVQYNDADDFILWGRIALLFLLIAYFCST